MRNKATVIVALILLAILIFESLAWDNLEELDVPHLAEGFFASIFVLLAVHWIVVAIRRKRSSRSRDVSSKSGS